MPDNDINYYQLKQKIKFWANELGFQDARFSDIDLSQHRDAYQQWIANGYQADMTFMTTHDDKRFHPEQLHPGTASIISVRMDYLPDNAEFAKTLEDGERAYISRYALGRDYHKVLRKKLKLLGDKIQAELDTLSLTYRPFVDSAPVLEHAIAEKAGIGWTGKHTLTINENAGSWFFLGELFISLAIPADEPVEAQCGNCVACLTICPTQAIVAPYQVDANRCISYLTIENKGPIPEPFRAAMGNRIYGCDDCQLICPWNKYAAIATEPDFTPRKQLSGASLLQLWQWSEADFLTATEGSPIRRIGYQSWLRNIAVALGNAPFSLAVKAALEEKLGVVSELVDEHINWALAQQKQKAQLTEPDNRKLNRLIKAVKVGLPRDA